MAKAKSDAVTKKKGNGKQGAAEGKKKGKKQEAAAAGDEPVTTKKVGRKNADDEPSVVAKKGDKKAGGKKKAAAPDDEPVAAKKAKKAGGKKKAAVADDEPVAAKKAKKAGGKKKAAAPDDEPVAAKKAGGKKKAAAKGEATGEKTGGKASGKAKTKKASKAKAKAKAKKTAGKPTRAEQLDKHLLYQLSVQSPEADIEFFAERYRELRGHEPKVLREDFCGTAYISATWAGSADDRRAIGVDLDDKTLQWGREHNLAPLSKRARARVDLRQANVLDGGGERSDLTCAMNFSYGVFKTRAELKHYIEVVHQQLADDGVFITELYGGTEAIVAVRDEREISPDDEEVGDFTYVWEQEAYNPITHETLCHIHFDLPDRSTIERAFTYDWRLWSIAEVRELLYEVGFTGVRVYWEATDEDGDGTGDYYPTEKEENQESWLVYLVAAK